MLMKRPQHRVFDYPPRFYKPEEDEQERRKRRLGFSQMRKYNKRQRNPIIWIVFIIIVTIVIVRLSGRG